MASLPIVPIDEILARAGQRRETADVVFSPTRRVCCEGSGGALGHPRVYYTIAESGFAKCGYCDRLFVWEPGRGENGHH